MLMIVSHKTSCCDASSVLPPGTQAEMSSLDDGSAVVGGCDNKGLEFSPCHECETLPRNSMATPRIDLIVLPIVPERGNYGRRGGSSTRAHRNDDCRGHGSVDDPK
jgi:hypothetical protein